MEERDWSGGGELTDALTGFCTEEKLGVVEMTPRRRRRGQEMTHGSGSGAHRLLWTGFNHNATQ
jgi:hypothetical protein